MILVIALLAAVIAAVVLLTTDAGQNTDLIKDTVREQLQVARGLHQSQHPVSALSARTRAGAAAARHGDAPLRTARL